jgi:ubiquinone/menaquinone biosynthesis C-methylase UbiE
MKINLLKSLPETWSKKPFKIRSKASVKDKILSWKLDKEYFDGSREQGYGGYKYDGRWRQVAKDIIKHYSLKDNAKILDIGCAKGFLLEEFRRILKKPILCGVDISSYAISKSISKGKYLSISNATCLPFDTNYFDLVLSINSLHNILDIDNLKLAFKEMNRVSKKNIYITIGSYKNAIEKKKIDNWAVVASSYMSNSSWVKFFKLMKYESDYWWFTPK